MKVTRQVFRQFGKEFAEGVILTLGKYFLIGVVLFQVLHIFIPIDDCDKSRSERCGMRILIDNKTKLQYLETHSGGLIPRLDINGKHMKDESN